MSNRDRDFRPARRRDFADDDYQPAGDYPSTDFAITEDGVVRRVVHLPSGMTIVTTRMPGDPAAVSSAYAIETEGSGSHHHPQEVTQAALRHLRVWLMHRNEKGQRGSR